MQCPDCTHSTLNKTKIDAKDSILQCDSCNGVWLNDVQLLRYARFPQIIKRHLKEALNKKNASGELASAWLDVALSKKDVFRYHRKKKGAWFSTKVAKETLRNSHHFQIEMLVEEKQRKNPKLEANLNKDLPKLPNLFMRSVLTLIILYGVLSLILITAVEFYYLLEYQAVLIMVAVALAQFIFSPFILDFTLHWLYHLKWVKRADLPPHLERFIEKVAKEENVAFPRIGMIHDHAPQAFTYGHFPGNARIVISQGILELLDEEEVEAVVAHEMGHAVHWDMLLMTVVQLVPMLLYMIYRFLRRSLRKGGGGGSKMVRIAFAIGTYILYVVSEYIVLWFSRTREYHADRFAGRVTGDPSALASALTKIAYGLVGQKDEVVDDTHKAEVNAIGAMGIFDRGAAKQLALTTYNPSMKNRAAAGPKKNLSKAMKWDMWNPWALWYELGSTHPLVAKRLLLLGSQARAYGKKPFITFNETKPESFLDEFLVDILVGMLPIIALIFTPALVYANHHFGGQSLSYIWSTIFTVGLAYLIKYQFMYYAKAFTQYSISELLSRVKVSGIRPIACKVQGKVIGRGVPGYIFSEDFVLRDKSAIIFLDYRQPLAIWEWFFSILKSSAYREKNVTVEGWYYRNPMPHIRIKHISTSQNSSVSWVPVLQKASAWVLTAVGAVGLFVHLL